MLAATDFRLSGLPHPKKFTWMNIRARESIDPTRHGLRTGEQPMACRPIGWDAGGRPGDKRNQA